ncbi:MAG: GAF domain-containing protein [Chthoniobacterales bacterium]
MWTAPQLSETLSKAELYSSLASQVRALLEGEPDTIAKMANCAALLFHALPEVNWVGFYRLQGNELVLGPFQGRPACVRIPIGRGVCGTAAEQRMTLRVANVEEFAGHIACDTASKSEVVVPLASPAGTVIGVLDIDSPRLGRFDAEDEAGLEKLAAIIAQQL